jgi:hypothetical protein
MNENLRTETGPPKVDPPPAENLKTQTQIRGRNMKTETGKLTTSLDPGDEVRIAARS